MGRYHPIPYQSKIREKFISLFGIGLSLSQTIWWAIGLMLSYRMSKVVPRIGSDWFYSRLHYVIPFAVCVFLCHTKHGPTGLPVWKYVLDVVRLRLRQRKFLYRRQSIPEEG
ncbi:MAG: hypothetical protein BAA01_11495 [Bacillus thermozeamaize]|uniref:Uncharacterized protein n=1 Tax=Bacillus thermozeamaize TaxID=230954 RepID=A0A1Y3PKF2_9BACI|nr:MAG: hypothetical protein BAA01_11495 [Bacillus thermozeamaize]